MASTVVASGDLPITVKCAFDGDARRFKINLRDVLVGNLEKKVRSVSLCVSRDRSGVADHMPS
jgi:next-to-BRCA1 protein 1